MKDFVSGVFMLPEDQYGVGDVVDLGEAVGEVESVGLRVTTIGDIDGTLWYVRNGEVSRVGNMSQDYAVAGIEIPVAHDVDLERAQEVALAAAQLVVADAAVSDDVLAPRRCWVCRTSPPTWSRSASCTRPGPPPSGREFGPSALASSGPPSER